MWDFHAKRLLQIRQNTLRTRKALVLQTYTYLRDTNANSFYHESMTRSLWDRLATLTVNPGEGESVGGQSAGASASTGGRGASSGEVKHPVVVTADAPSKASLSGKIVESKESTRKSERRNQSGTVDCCTSACILGAQKLCLGKSTNQIHTKGGMHIESKLDL
jgi:hypothetical protein